MSQWAVIKPLVPVPWGWGLWSFMGEPSHYLAENERGERYYVPRDWLALGRDSK